MQLNTKYDIGQVIHLFDFPDWPCVITAITVRASGQVEYQLDWNCGGDVKTEWYEEKRIELFAKLTKENNEDIRASETIQAETVPAAGRTMGEIGLGGCEPDASRGDRAKDGA